MQRCITLICLLSSLLNLFSNIKINEIYYDPAGSDSGYEWVELYNPTNQSVDISGWKIEKAGTSFTTAATIESATIQPLSFFLIGEEFVEGADYITDLGLQNGGSATDGVRLISEDGLYTDTVLYDEPNSNLLPDDLLEVGISFAPDVSSGHSLARISDGLDSNNSQEDWADCEAPTPKSTNIFPIDLEIRELNWQESESGYELFTTIYNLSTVAVDNSQSSLKIYLNDNYFNEYCLPPICANDSIFFSLIVTVNSGKYTKLEAELICLYDNNLTNNNTTCYILTGESPIVLNEIFYKPLAHSCEWIEIFNRSNCGYLVDNFVVRDASGQSLSFSAFLESEDYLVICQDSQLVACQYPELDEAKIIQPETWLNLNNTSEEIYLGDDSENSFDFVFYEGNECENGYSLERINPWLESDPQNWCSSLMDPTPGYRNSVYVFQIPEKSSLTFHPNPFSPRKGEHCLLRFSLPQLLSCVTIRIFDLKGRKVKQILDQQLQSAEGTIIWNGKDDKNRILPMGIYIVLFEATSIETEKVYRITDTIVIAN